MNSAFRILVFAVVAVAALWIFSTFFAPLFNPPTQFTETIQRGLQSAKAQVGQVTSMGNLEIPSGTFFSNATFANEKTDLVFECNNPQYCCEKGAVCNQKTAWNEQRVTFNQAQRIPAFTRCQFEFEFFACKIFFGQKPAQVTIEPVSIPNQIDLAKQNTLSFSTRIQNTGEQTAVQGLAEVFFQKKMETGPMADFQTVFSQQQLFSELPSNQSTVLNWTIPLEKNGEYRLRIQAKSDNAGMDISDHEFRLFNEATACQALTSQAPQTEFDSQTGLCTTKFACVNCNLAVDCRLQWQNAQPQTDFQIGDPGFAQTVVVSTASECR